MRKLSENNEGIFGIIALILAAVFAMSIISIMWSVIAFIGAIMIIAGLYLLVFTLHGNPNAIVNILIIVGIIMVGIGFFMPNMGFQIAIPGAEFFRSLMSV